MSLVERVYKWLAMDMSPGANRILAAALEHAEHAYARPIAELLLGRRHETAWMGLVGNCDRLPKDLLDRVNAKPDLVRLGIAAVLRGGDARAKGNALRMLAGRPCPDLSYLASEALLDRSQAVKAAAAHALWCCAEHVLDNAPADQFGRCRSPESVARRAELVASLREALASFERHQQVKVIEVCLWFAKELGDDLWQRLSEPRSRVAHVVEQHQELWDGPRLAGFLLLALARRDWRSAARKQLGSWSRKEELIAILRHSDLLARPDVAKCLRWLKTPSWLGAAGPGLTNLTAAARAVVPLWVCHLGFSDDQRVRCLARWQASRHPEVHRASVYALAHLNTPAALQVLTVVASHPGPLRQFAAWYLAGRPEGQTGQRPSDSSPAAAPSGGLASGAS